MFLRNEFDRALTEQDLTDLDLALLHVATNGPDDPQAHLLHVIVDLCRTRSQDTHFVAQIFDSVRMVSKLSPATARLAIDTFSNNVEIMSTGYANFRTLSTFWLDAIAKNPVGLVEIPPLRGAHYGSINAL